MTFRFQLGSFRYLGPAGLVCGVALDALLFLLCDWLFETFTIGGWTALLLATAWLDLPFFLARVGLRSLAISVVTEQAMALVSLGFMVLLLVGLIGPLWDLVALPLVALATPGLEMGSFSAYLGVVGLFIGCDVIAGLLQTHVRRTLSRSFPRGRDVTFPPST